MEFTHSDLQPYLPATAAEIKPQLDANPITRQKIPRPDLRTWLSETSLLRSGASGWSGWLVTLAAAVPAVAPVIDWLCDALTNPDLTHLRTDTSEPVAAGLAAIQQAVHAAPEGCPLPIEDIDAQLLAWTGGRRFEGVTVEQIQAVIDAHAAAVARDAAMTLADEGYHRARQAIDAGETDWPTIVDTFATPAAPEEE